MEKRIRIFFREKLLRKIKPSEERVRSHMIKARHNLKAAEINKTNNLNDWSIIASYYAAYHSALSLLVKVGILSKSHEATIMFLEEFFVKKGKLRKTYLENLQKLAKAKEEILLEEGEIRKIKLLKSRRITAQYGVSTSFDSEIVNDCINAAREIILEMESLSERLDEKMVDKIRRSF